MLLFRGDEVLFQYPRINAFVQHSVYLWDYLNILAVASATPKNRPSGQKPPGGFIKPCLNQRELLQLPRPVLPSLPVQEPAHPLIEMVPRLDHPGELLDDGIELVPGQVHLHHRGPERRHDRVPFRAGRRPGASAPSPRPVGNAGHRPATAERERRTTTHLSRASSRH